MDENSVRGTFLIGSNILRNTSAILIVCGQEVFRVRERTGDGQLVIDFELADTEGKTVLKVRKNNVVFAGDEFEVIHGARATEVVSKNAPHQRVIRIEEISAGTLRLTGDFSQRGIRIVATDTELRVHGTLLVGNDIDGLEGIEIDERGFAI